MSAGRASRQQSRRIVAGVVAAMLTGIGYVNIYLPYFSQASQQRRRVTGGSGNSDGSSDNSNSSTNSSGERSAGLSNSMWTKVHTAEELLKDVSAKNCS